jgi:hypothetical protein
MAAPSAGSARVHEVEQAAVIAAAFAAVTPEKHTDCHVMNLDDSHGRH